MKSYYKFASMTAALALLLSAGTTAAQGFGRGPQLTDEESEAAWRTQGWSVVMSAEVDREKARDVVAAYTESRKAYNTAAEAANFERGDFQARMDLREEHNTKLEAKLKELVTEEQLAKITPLMTSNSRQWDRLAHTLLSFELERPQNGQAMQAVNAYVLASNEAMAKARENQDFGAAREPMQKAREEMNKALGEILNAEQLAKWEEETAPRFPGGGNN